MVVANNLFARKEIHSKIKVDSSRQSTITAVNRAPEDEASSNGEVTSQTGNQSLGETTDL